MSFASTTVGIIGTSPRERIGCHRFSRFDRFQQTLGELEAVRPGEFWAGHAACHALMNGVARVVFAGVVDLGTAESLARCCEDLVRREMVDVLVVPGLVDPPLTMAAVSAFEQCRKEMLAEQRPAATTFLLDAPAGRSVDEILQYRKTLGGDPYAVRLVLPWVRTITPGRRTWERLPPTCLIAPLFLATTAHLRGAHEFESGTDLASSLVLQQAGCGVMEARGRRNLVQLAFPVARPPIGAVEPDDPEPQVASLESRILAALEEACQFANDAVEPGPSLWKSLERTSRAALEGFRQSGEISGFLVRCDEETNEGSGGHPVVEVYLKLPRRVREVILRLGPLK